MHPDPFTAALDATHDERVDEIIVSTFPGDRSGLAAPRPRRAPPPRARQLPVDHVVAEGMSAAADAHGHRAAGCHGHGDANLHPPPIHYSSRISPLIVGIFLFIGSEIMLFGSFFTVYFFDRVVEPDARRRGRPSGFHPARGSSRSSTRCILVTSSFTDALGDAVDQARQPRRALQAGMVLTFLLGLTFLLTQVVEYHRIGFNTSDRRFAATFFGLTGLHGFHVFVGLTILLVMTIRVVPGPLQPRAPSRRRGRRNLLALRRRDVDRGVRHGLHSVST